MTEATWLECSDPLEMLEFLGNQVSERKLRLFACACCREVAQSEPSARLALVELAERYADGTASVVELASVPDPYSSGSDHFLTAARLAAQPDIRTKILYVCETAALVVGCDAYSHRSYDDALATADMMDAQREAASIQADLLREIIGNPFLLINFDPAWRTPTIMALAAAASDERIRHSGCLDPKRLAVLSDALEEAGCNDPLLLGHLRGPEYHFQGCWTIDLILAKS